MTEEIIIDGVNVAGCEQRFSDNKCALLDQYFCENNPDCYYKQLKRLEQENKEINERMSDVIYRATGGRLCYSTYTLDAIEQAFYDQLEILSDKKTKELEQENEELEEKFLNLNGKSYSYRKALEEIREMVNEPCVPSENDCLTCPTSCFTKDILIKINEVLK